MNAWSKLAAACVLAFAAMQSFAAASLVDTSFHIGTGADDIVEHVLQQPDGKILICGLFRNFNGQPMPWIGRLNTDGTVDTSFHAQVPYWVRHMVLQPDSKIVIGGEFNSVEGAPRNLIARLNPDGSLDHSFDPGAGCEVSIGTGIDGNPAPFIIWMDIQPDGKLLLTGNFGTYDGFPSRGIVRVNPDGSRDATFNVGAGFDTWGRFVRPLPNGQILASGWFTSYNNHSFNRLVRINSDGSFDTTLNAFFGDKTSVYSVIQFPDGKLITCGHSLNDQGLFKREIERLNPDGSVDGSWVGHTDEKTETAVLMPDGKVIVGGYFAYVDNQNFPLVARFNTDGTLDTSFRIVGDYFVWNIFPTPDNKLLICGRFTQIDGYPLQYVARLYLPESLPVGDIGTVQISGSQIVNGRFQCTVQSATGHSYTLQYASDIAASDWTSLAPVDGTGGVITLQDTQADGTRFYRVEAQ